MYLYNLQVSANILHLLDICESFLQFSIFLLIKIELQLFGVYVVKEKQFFLVLVYWYSAELSSMSDQLSIMELIDCNATLEHIYIYKILCFVFFLFFSLSRVGRTYQWHREGYRQWSLLAMCSYRQAYSNN